MLVAFIYDKTRAYALPVKTIKTSLNYNLPFAAANQQEVLEQTDMVVQAVGKRWIYWKKRNQPDNWSLV